MDNDVRFTNPDKSHDPTHGSGSNSYKYPVIGIVKDNIDPNCSGALRVQLEGSTKQDSPQTDSASWVTVQRASTFHGSVSGSGGSTGTGSFKTNTASYGQWNAPPDLGTKVLCFFVNGDPTRGYYLGFIPDADSLHMVPAIGATANVVPNSAEAQAYSGATRVPVTNINTENTDVANSDDFNAAAKPIHSYAAAIMSQQGIIKDPIRGPISSSASREPVSRVGWGVSTPGRPIYQGGYDDSNLPDNLSSANNAANLQVISRRGGHSFVMDDGDIAGRDQLIRIRTALGHQILMSDDGQTMMILHSNGQTYIELGKEGTIDCYATNSINFRTHGDINFHAQRNINMHAEKAFNIHANSYQVDSDQTIKFSSVSDTNFSISGKYTVKAGGALALASGGDASLVGGGSAYINGTKVKLNSGAPGTSPVTVNPISTISHSDTVFDSTKGFVASPGTLKSITSRSPAHAPWTEAGFGVDVNVSLDGGSSTSSPSANVNSSSNSVSVSNGTVSQIKAPPVSSTLDSSNTSIALAGIATLNSTNGGNSTNSGGAAIVSVSNAAPGTSLAAANTSNSISVGSYGLTPDLMALGGMIKPGSNVLINSLSSNTSNVLNILPNILFTGSNGSSSLNYVVKNTKIQTSTLVSALQKTQTSLSGSGLLGSNQSLNAGVLNAGMTQGTSNIINPILSNNLNSSIASALSLGNSVSKFVSSSGLSGVSTTASFNTLVSASTNLQYGIPQNLTLLSSALTGSINAISNISFSNSVGNDISSVLGAFGTPSYTKSSGISSTNLSSSYALAGGMIAFRQGGLSQLSSVAKQISAGNIIGGATSVATGISSLSSGLSGIMSITNSSSTSISAISNLLGTHSPSVPSINSFSSAGSITQALGSLTNDISSVNSMLSSFSGNSQASKTPSVGTNTVNRNSITSHITKLLGDASIPNPASLNIGTSPVSSSSSSVSSLVSTISTIKGLF